MKKRKEKKTTKNTPNLSSTAALPVFRDSLYHCATLPGCVDDLNVIWGKLNQISQGTWLNDGRVSDKVLLKIHRLHRLRERNLVGDEQVWQGENQRDGRS